MTENQNEEPDSLFWLLVLAGGDGLRLAPLVRLLCGHDLPKQFATCLFGRSMLQGTLDRLAPLWPHRTVVVVNQAFADVAQDQIRGYPRVDLVPQPRNLGTGPGVLLGLRWILAKDPGATVAIIPSDHHFTNPEPLLDAVRTARRFAGTSPDHVTLLGAVPDRPESDYGWILPGPPLPAPGRLHRVRRFVEKPTRPVARRLLDAGALWNTFVTVGTLTTLWDLARKFLPGQCNAFEPLAPRGAGKYGGRGLDRVYESMEPASFSHAVLQRAESLTVIPLDGSGWWDLGTPERFLRFLRQALSPPPGEVPVEPVLQPEAEPVA